MQRLEDQGGKGAGISKAKLKYQDGLPAVEEARNSGRKGSAD